MLTSEQQTHKPKQSKIRYTEYYDLQSTFDRLYADSLKGKTFHNLIGLYENPPADYEIPPAYLEDEQFARLIEEAEKYVGFPYVWGGSSPETSFDCSGFVSYVLTNSGLYNTGRLGAQGLYNISTPVSSPQPGDLVFFTGTYDTPGVSHVGIYVGEDGDGSPIMLHCGDPIQYTKLDTSYWQSHFYAYGRLNYN